jgi:LDH2 family malate/lactate/ureidoglycolate dehydrogenase
MSGALLSDESLRAFVRDIMLGLKAPEENAQVMADSLVAANLRGVDSHGLQLLPFYVAQIEDGRVNASGKGKLAFEAGALVSYDGENCLGQLVARECCRHAARVAKEHGLGLVVARESNHFGAAAWWAKQISGEGMIGVVLCNASAIVAPWQGSEPRWGTNPICVSVPGGGWLLDMATTTVAMGRIYKAGINREPEIPPGWAMDSDGAPTTSTEAALQGLLMPLGGYKGSGLAMMVEMLTGVLSGGAISTELGGLRVKSQPFRVSQFFLAIDVERLMPREEFEERMARLVAMAKSSKPARGEEEVLVAGEPEWREESRRRLEGIPVSGPLWEQLTQIAGRLGVTLPTR